MADVTEDLTVLFESFLSSEPYKRLQRATVLGREVPFVMPLGEGQMMEGVIDLIYRLDDRIWIADYKTDDVAAEDATGQGGSLPIPSGELFTSRRECFRIVRLSRFSLSFCGQVSPLMSSRLRKNYFGIVEFRWPACLGQGRSFWSIWLEPISKLAERSRVR